MEDSELDTEDIFSIFAAMPFEQLVLIGIFFATWLIGGNILVAFHYKRIGKHWASGFKPFAFPFKNFNAKEWFILLLLAIVALSFGVAGITYAP